MPRATKSKKRNDDDKSQRPRRKARSGGATTTAVVADAKNEKEEEEGNHESEALRDLHAELLEFILNLQLVQHKVRPGYLFQAKGWSDERVAIFILIKDLQFPKLLLNRGAGNQFLFARAPAIQRGETVFRLQDAFESDVSLGTWLGYTHPGSTFDEQKAYVSSLDVKYEPTDGGGGGGAATEVQLFGSWAPRPVDSTVVDKVARNIMSAQVAFQDLPLVASGKVDRRAVKLRGELADN